MKIFFFALFLAFFALLASLPAKADENRRQIIFLPLKINAPADRDMYAQKADGILQEILPASKIIFIPRQLAQQALNYQASWPPSPNKIRSSLPAAAHADYVAAGSVTVTGSTLSIDLTVFDLFDSAGKSHPKGALQNFFYRKADNMAELSSKLAELADEVVNFSSRQFQIAAITIKGNKKIDTGAILNRLKSKVGDPYNKEQLRSDLKNIFQMGYFDDIQIETTDSADGKKIAFLVTERAVIKKVVFDGIKNLKEDELLEVITVKAGRIISTKEIREAVDNIKKLYREKGYYNTSVTTNLNYPKDGQVEVHFVIDEGPKVYVKEIRLNGNQTFTDRTLKKNMVTTEKGLFSWITESGVLKRDMLEHDAARITAFYHDNGFLEAKVGEPVVTQEDKWLYITFNIAEGDRFGVGTIDLTGDLIADKEELLKLVYLGKEEYFSRKTLREDILRVTDFYAEKGFAFAEAFPSIEKDGSGTKMNLVIDIRKAQLVSINRILIKGNTRTRDKVIRREIAIKEGATYDAAAIRESNQRLTRLGFFEEVNVTPEPTLEDNVMDIVVNVKEKPTGNFSIGAGYSSVDHVIFMSEVSQNNLFGRGQRLSLQANISGTSSRYNLSFTEPHIFDSKLLAGIDLYDWEREYTDYTKDSQGFAVRFGYPVWEKWYLFWSYGYDETHLNDINEATASQVILDSRDINFTSYARLGLQRDTRDRLYDASKGSTYSINLKYAGGPLGGDSGFTKYEGSAGWYVPTFWKTTLHLNCSAGYVSQNSGGKLPVYEKFYLGGINTIRGFESSSISPVDPKGSRIGGDKMWYTNLEYIFPLVPSAGLKGVIFYDAGNVYDIGESWDFSNLKESIGYGFRWLSPMGPLRLEWGYNLHPEEGEDHSSWDFTIGGAF